MGRSFKIHVIIPNNNNNNNYKNDYLPSESFDEGANSIAKAFSTRSMLFIIYNNNNNNII